ncbi:hypothetical protein ACS3YM_14275 [Nocardia sp. N13]|uniref:hypothetical protein n=1 Tax=Nocardioides sp. N13(2025) TaxID=3453405 RepID=UPI003F772E98
MPIPLIVAALIAAGAAGGTGGAALGGKGAINMNKARKTIRKAEADYASARKKAEKAAEKTNQTLVVYGGQQEKAIRIVVMRLGDFLRRHAKQVKDAERLLVDGLDADAGRVGLEEGNLSVSLMALVGGAATSAAVGGTASAGVTAAVGAYGVASTGTAISGLSGAAASNATLAALGGGSLAAGGGGMALGATVLNFVTVGPALLVGGMVLKGQGTKALTQAKKYEAAVNVEVARLSADCALFKAVRMRVTELSALLDRLVARGIDALDLLESEEFDRDTHADRFQAALSYALAVRDVAATPVVDSNGDINDGTGSFTVKYRSMVDEEKEVD